MGDKSAIEWTDATWNPIVGCSIVSPGCTNCYAMRTARRLELIGIEHYRGTTRSVNGNTVWTGKLGLAPESILTKPLSWKRPRRIFVNSMGDLFHEDAPDEWIDRVFAVMALAPQHTFQILTKRAERMRAYLTQERVSLRWANEGEMALGISRAALDSFRNASKISKAGFPLPHCWLGVSAEDQQRADERIPALLATPAAVRFVSAEPLIGPINFRRLHLGDGIYLDALTGCHEAERPFDFARPNESLAALPTLPGRLPALDLVIAGGESGPNARPMDLEWIRDILGQRLIVGTSIFVKQLGSNPYSDGRPMHGQSRGKYNDPSRWPADLRVREMPGATA